MPISVVCRNCGRQLNIKDELAGRKIRCPDCKEVLAVPDAADDPPVVEAVADEPDDTFRVRDEKPVRPRETYRTHPDRNDDPLGSLKRRLADEDERPRDDDDDGPPRPRRRPRPAPQRPQRDSWGINAGVGGGLLMMLIAVVWFVAGLFAGIIFYYPPILFIIGLVAFFRGLVNRT